MDHGFLQSLVPPVLDSPRLPAVAIALTCAFLTACASGGAGTSSTRGGSGPVEVRTAVGGRGAVEITADASVRDSVLSVAPATVWSVLPGVFRRLDIETTIFDAQSLAIGNPGATPRRIERARISTYLDCGTGFGGPNADRYEVTLYLVVQLAGAAAGGTRVTTILDASARPRDVRGNAVHCSSKGTLERRVMELIGQLTGDGHP